MNDVHDTAARGFDSAARLYARARPGYPVEAVDFVVSSCVLASGARVLDLAAGTGKFTEELYARGMDVVAVEPVSGMRAAFREALPDVPVLDGTAEAIPLADGSVDAVTVAQAFHWFANERAVAEIHRVLRPSGRLALVWNARDERTDWVARITEVLAPYEGAGGMRVPRHREQGWRPAIEGSPLFGAIAAREFPYEQPMTPALLLERFASISFIAVLSEDERARALDKVRALIATHPDLKGKAEFVHPYVTEVYVFARRS